MMNFLNTVSQSNVVSAEQVYALYVVIGVVVVVTFCRFFYKVFTGKF